VEEAADAGEVVPAEQSVTTTAPGEAAAAVVAEPPKQAGGGSGIYMFINPPMGGMVEHKARRAYHRPTRHIQWAGMPEAQAGGGPGLEDLSEIGGGPSASGPTEVMVEKVE
jgi:hypothetical protein